MSSLPKEKIIELAAQAGFGSNPFCQALVRHSNGSWVGVEEQLIEFTRLVLAEVAAPMPDADGWITWVGGECPVSDDTVVEVQLREGVFDHALSGDYYWDHRGDADIVAYRVIEQKDNG